MNGRGDARQDELRLLAWHAANIMQMWTKTRLTASKLLGEKRELTEMYTSVEEIKEHYRNRSKKKPQ